LGFGCKGIKKSGQADEWTGGMMDKGTVTDEGKYKLILATKGDLLDLTGD